MKRRVAAVVLALAMLASSAAQAALFEPVRSNLVSASFTRWASPVKDYIIDNGNGTVSVICYRDTPQRHCEIKTYDRNGVLLSTGGISVELSLFGGFFSGQQYNFAVFGQRNTEQDDEKEVIRIVRYDKTFRRLGSVSVTGGAATARVPFDGGCPRMAEYGDTLVLHTSIERYTSLDDGQNHQSSLTVTIDTAAMSLTEISPYNVSHSFDQYVLFDGAYPVFLDHGDAYPRSITLRAASPEGRRGDMTADLFMIPGDIGANCTGVSIGGFAVSNTSYIAAINTIDHARVTKYTSLKMEGLDLDQRDIVLCVLPKRGGTVEQITVGSYVGSDKIASIPYLIPFPENYFAVLWQEFDAEHKDRGDLVYLVVDGSGNVVVPAERLSGYALSACRPILDGDGRLTWFSDTENNGKWERTFYTIDGIPAALPLSVPVSHEPPSSPSSWAAAGVAEAEARGLVTAALSADYTAVTTRREFCAAAANFISVYYGKPIEQVLRDRKLSPAVFSDVTDADVLAAAALGVAGGVGDGRFDPEGVLTREQAATMLANLLHALGFITMDYSDIGFVDAGDISPWARRAVNMMYRHGIMTGVSATEKRFSPQGAYTHEQSIVTLNSLYATLRR